MSGKRNVIHTDKELQIASRYFKYHVRMYVETLLWLQNHPLSIGWDTVGNAVLEDHLVHARILINFISMGNSRNRKDDVLAEDYFHDIPDVYEPLSDEFLNRQAQDIGSQAVHITKKSMPTNRSQKDWPIRNIKEKLTPAIESFLYAVPETKLADDVKQDCMEYLVQLAPLKIPVSIHSST